MNKNDNKNPLLDMHPVHGVITALITPMTESGEIDYDDLQSLIEYQLKAGIDGLVINGTTGESPTLSNDELIEIIKFSRELLDQFASNNKNKPILIVGAGANSTNSSIVKTNLAQQHGADMVMLVAPYYNKPTQAGLYEHFKTIHDHTELPIILYNVPGRTGVDMSDSTIAKLSLLPRIIAIKDATDNLNRPLGVHHIIQNHRISVLNSNLEKPSSFSLLTGNDQTALSFYANGGSGMISVASNLLPRTCKKIFHLFTQGQVSEALELHRKIYAFNEAIFAESNPIPIKYVMMKAGLIKNDQIRQPLCRLGQPAQKIVDQALIDLDPLLKEYEGITMVTTDTFQRDQA